MDMMFCFLALFASAVGAVWMHRQSAPSLRVKPTRRSLASPFYREDPAEPGSPVVLIVDDNPDIRRCLRLILNPMGTILEAGSGEEAMSLAMRYRLALVMADGEMGPVDGMDLCRALKAHAPVPVIMMTANDDRTPRCEAPEAGADACLTKPFDLRDVRRLVGSMIGWTDERWAAGRSPALPASTASLFSPS